MIKVGPTMARKKEDRLHSRVLNIVLLTILILVFMFSSTAFAEHEYVGASSCKICHRLAKYGDQYSIWENSAHARAYETLSTDKAKENGRKHGVDDPRKSIKCLKCHATAADAPPEAKEDSYKIEEGVTCEACHGPGSDYKSMSIMKDREKALANGLIIGDKETCLKCHIPEGNDFYIEFDYERAWSSIAHPKPAK
jgi:hypothetical protein